MGSTHQVIFAPQSLRDLQAVVRFISLHAGAEVAIRFGNQMVEKALSLCDFPLRGRVVPETGLPYREILYRSYRIVYRLSEDRVEIVRFWHAARGTPQIDSDEFREER